MNVAVAGCSRRRNAAILHKPYRLKRELAVELPFLNSKLAAPLNTLYRRTRNRQQAVYMNHVIHHLRSSGEGAPAEWLPYLALLSWQHISLMGGSSGPMSRGSRPMASGCLTNPGRRRTLTFPICPLLRGFLPVLCRLPYRPMLDALHRCACSEHCIVR